jgi:hypothetical protein
VVSLGDYTGLLFSLSKVVLMHDIVIKELSADRMNYDEAPIVALEVDGIEYRIDTGHGSALAISQREPGTWDWTPVTEGSWDGSRLRAKSLSHRVNTVLAQALGAAMGEREERGVA